MSVKTSLRELLLHHYRLSTIGNNRKAYIHTLATQHRP